MINVELAEAAKEEAISRVDANADPNWKERALEAVRTLALANKRFTTDDLWVLIEPPREPRALGPVMRRAWNKKWIKPLKKHLLSDRVECHRRPLRVWSSRIFRREMA